MSDMLTVTKGEWALYLTSLRALQHEPHQSWARTHTRVSLPE